MNSMPIGCVGGSLVFLFIFDDLENALACLPQVLFKMDNEGHGQEIQLRNLAANTPLSLCNWKNSMVRGNLSPMCVTRSNKLTSAGTKARWYNHHGTELFPMCEQHDLGMLCIELEVSVRGALVSSHCRINITHEPCRCFLDITFLYHWCACNNISVFGPVPVGRLRLHHLFHQGPRNHNCTQARAQPSEPGQGGLQLYSV